MLCSVIVPVHNGGRYLRPTLNSIVSQTYDKLELIIINDGSTDNSVEIIEEFERSFPFVRSYYQNSAGQCAASNLGIQKSNGEYIKFVDADDIINPEHIERQVDRLGGRTDAIASCEWGRFYDGNPQSAQFIPEPVWVDMKPIDWLKTALGQRIDMMGAWLWLIPRQILEKSGAWDERLSLNNDFEFSTRLLLHAKEVLFTPGAKVHYRSGLVTNLAGSRTKEAYEAALLSSELGCQYLLDAEDTIAMKRICANRYQEWAFRIYPDYPELVRDIEQKVKSLGGSTISMDGGKAFRFIRFFLGWKMAKNIQLLLYKLGYQPKHPHA